MRPQVGLFGAVSTGLAAILGAGIFAVIAPATGLAGPAVLLAFALAAFVALCNALSSAQLAAVLPRTGGTYEFGRRMLGPRWGYSAGWMFLAANTVGPGAIALAFAGYLTTLCPSLPTRGVAVVMTLTITGLNALGIRRSIRVTGVVVAFSLIALGAVVAIGLPHARFVNLVPFAPGGASGVFAATGLLFFAYTGYSRIATLVEEVREPKRTIPRATGLALGGATTLYLLVALTALAVLGPTAMARSASPLEAAMIAAGSAGGVALVVSGALSTTFNEGLSDLLGVSRVAFAMGRGHDLPEGLSRLGAGQNPWFSVVAVGGVSTLVAGLLPFTFAIALSSFGTLLYYAITNLSALRLRAKERMFPRALMVAGLVGCVGLAVALPPTDVIVGLGVLAVGWMVRGVRHGLAPRGPVPAAPSQRAL